MNWTSPRMLELLLLDRPRKPVGPEDAMVGDAAAGAYFYGFYGWTSSRDPSSSGKGIPGAFVTTSSERSTNLDPK